MSRVKHHRKILKKIPFFQLQGCGQTKIVSANRIPIFKKISIVIFIYVLKNIGYDIDDKIITLKDSGRLLFIKKSPA